MEATQTPQAETAPNAADCVVEHRQEGEPHAPYASHAPNAAQLDTAQVGAGCAAGQQVEGTLEEAGAGTMQVGVASHRLAGPGQQNIGMASEREASEGLLHARARFPVVSAAEQGILADEGVRIDQVDAKLVLSLALKGH